MHHLLARRAAFIIPIKRLATDMTSRAERVSKIISSACRNEILSYDCGARLMKNIRRSKIGHGEGDAPASSKLICRLKLVFDIVAAISFVTCRGHGTRGIATVDVACGALLNSSATRALLSSNSARAERPRACFNK